MIHYGRKPSGDLEITVTADGVGEVYDALCQAELLQRRTLDGLKRCIENEFRDEAWLEKQGEQKSVEKEFTFKAIPRLLEMIQPSERAKSYCGKLADTLDKEGYHSDANIVKESIKIMNGEKVPMATMDEQKPVEWSEEDKRCWINAISACEQAAEDYDHSQGYIDASNWLQSLKDRCLPQPKPEWTKEDEMMLKEVHNHIVYALCEQDGSYSEDESVLIWLKSLKDRVMPKQQEWSEEDKKMLLSIINAFRNGTVSTVKQEDWLKSLKDRCIPQPQQEWSEEDETMLALLHNCIGHYYADDIIKKEQQLALEDWLKSLRPQKKEEWSQKDIDMIDWLIRCCEKEHEELCNDRYGHQDIVSDLKRDCRKKWDWLESLKEKVVPQKQWKPSEEQMKALYDSIPENVKEISEREMLLNELYKDLRKEYYGR